MMPRLNEFDVINMYGDLTIYLFFVSTRQKVVWLGTGGFTLNLMSWACKGYTSTSEIETLDSNVRQMVLKYKKR